MTPIYVRAKSLAINAWQFIGNNWTALTLVLPLISLSPLLCVELHKLLSRPERQHFPLLLACVIAFVVRARQQRTAGFGSAQPVQVSSTNRLIASLVILCLSLLLLTASIVFFSPWLAHLAAIGFFTAWALGDLPAQRWVTIAAWTGLLIITLPLPFAWDAELVAWLQANSSWACSKAMDAFSVPHLRTAYVFELQGRKLFVEEACSGVTSLHALLATAALLLYLSGRSLAVSVISLATVPIWAIFGNFVRLLSIALAQHYYGHDLSSGWDHELLGTSTFILSCLGYWLSEIAIATLLAPIPPTEPQYRFIFVTANALLCWPNPDPIAAADSEDELAAVRQRKKALAVEKQAAVRRLSWREHRATRGLVQATGLLALILLIPSLLGLLRRNPRELAFLSLPHITDQVLQSAFPGESFLPAQNGDWKRIGFERAHRNTDSFFGEHSLLWHYSWGDQHPIVSLDFPFRGWHGLEVCYRNSGWHVDSLEAMLDSESQTPWPWMEVRISNAYGSKAFLCYALFTDSGEPYSGPVDGAINRTLAARIRSALQHSQLAVEPVCYQIQLLCETGSQLSQQEELECREQFLEFRTPFLKQKIHSGWKPEAYSNTEIQAVARPNP